MKLRHAFILTGCVLASAAWAFDPLPTTVPAPANNPTTPAKVALGKALYFDPRLSKTGTVSCQSCHHVTSNGTDNRMVSMGVYGLTGQRSAPTVWNSGFLSAQFWDGRAPSLEEQAKGPLVNPVEMGFPSHDALIEKLRAIPEYSNTFKESFGTEDLTIEHLAQAIA